MDKLSLVREFWNETPCDGQATYALRAQFRYRKEPWLLPFLDRVAATCQCILEVGCGQGTDGVTLSQRMRPGSQYIGVDMSEVSLARARAAAQEVRDSLRVTPAFRLENAEQLSFADNSFECVLSVGALHHSQETERAIAEVRRVLVPGGTAFVFLYRTMAPKVFVAHALRAMQRCLDLVLRTDRAIYRVLRRLKIGDRAGTAIYECFGVPILRSYSHRSMRALFRDFSALKLSSHGSGLPLPTMNRRFDRLASNPLGYLWLAEAVK
ncbi:MAG TPA: class I SAM-dependent methyltransferase [Terriglobales bacterium]|nr:class I SAM-dependent methyltransferase [Terriglobales bacterium]